MSVYAYTTPSGARRWGFVTDVGTRGRRRQIRRQGFATRRDARDALETTRRRYAGVTDPSAVTVGAYLSEWVEHRAATGAIRATTADSYRRIVAQIDDELGALRLDALAADHLDRLYRRLLTEGGRDGTGRSPRTVRYLHSVIRAALADAVRKGTVAVNVADAATPPSSSASRAPEAAIWSADEGAAFASWAELPTYRRIVWTTALATGLRRGELCGLRWADLDGDALAVVRTRTTAAHVVVEGAPKTERGRRVVHLPAPLVEALGAWKAEQARHHLRAGLHPAAMFTDAVLQPWHPDAMSRAWARDVRAAVAAGVVSTTMRLHDTRHWHATRLVAAGVDLRTVADRLGHATAAFTLAVYGHSDAGRDRAAAEVIADVL